MKVIFLQEIKGTAHRDEVKEVADGYALNYLLPRKLAVRATPSQLAAVAEGASAKLTALKREFVAAQAMASELKGKTISLSLPAASTGTLYATVNTDAIVQAIRDQLKVILNSKQVQVSPHVKTIGQHQLKVELHPDVTTQLILSIQPAS